MKRCPKCNLDYFDNVLEFCLEDGAKLTPYTASSAAQTKEIHPGGQMPSTEKTLNLPFSKTDSPPAQSVPKNRSGEFSQTLPHVTDVALLQKNKLQNLHQTIIQKGSKVLEITPIVFALAHNWWQWIYLDKQYFASVASFIFSAYFLLWLFLLISGACIGLYSVRYSPRKALAYTSLVILSINLLLFLVPGR
jgi:hypothetical protein